MGGVSPSRKSRARRYTPSKGWEYLSSLGDLPLQKAEDTGHLFHHGLSQALCVQNRCESIQAYGAHM